MTVEEWIDMSSALDIDGHEFYWLFTPETKSGRRDLLARVKDQDRSIPMMCYSPDFTKPDRADRMAEVEAEKRALDACGDLGVKFCRVLSGQRRPGLEVHETVSWVVECIQLLLPLAHELGITLILENHYKDGFWEYPEFAQSKDVFMSLLEAISGNIRTLA